MNDNITLKTLEDFMKLEFSQNDLEQIYFVFTDPSSGENPGWPLRLFMAALLKACPNLSDSELKVIALRADKTGGIASSSRTFTVVTKVCLFQILVFRGRFRYIFIYKFVVLLKYGSL